MSLADTISSGFGDVHRSGPREEDPTSLPADDIFHLLQTRRRRDILRYLRDADGPVRMRDLAEQVAAWEQETTVEALTSSERQRVYISLYQSHLPKLETAGVIDYQQDRGLVERLPPAAQLDPFLDEVTAETAAPEARWARRHAGTAAICVAVLGVTATGAVPITELAAAALIVGAFSVTTFAHLYSSELPL